MDRILGARVDPSKLFTKNGALTILTSDDRRTCSCGRCNMEVQSCRATVGMMGERAELG